MPEQAVDGNVQDKVATIVLAKAIDGQIGHDERCGDETALNGVPN